MVYVPSSHDWPIKGVTKRVVDPEREIAYNTNTQNGKSTWVLPAELLRFIAGGVRILRLIADEVVHETSSDSARLKHVDNVCLLPARHITNNNSPIILIRSIWFQCAWTCTAMNVKQRHARS